MIDVPTSGEVSWLGVMSGTSGDGIDVARVTIDERPEGPQVRSVEGTTLPFSAPLAARLSRALPSEGSYAAASRWHAELGDEFADAAAEAIARFGEVSGIVISGQTFAHHPTEVPRHTLQLGCPHRVARATGVPVLFDLRTTDIAQGGEGAPLVPAGDRVLFGDLADRVAVVNIGGISNVTVLSRDSDPAAADAGPGNLILNALYRDAFPDRGSDAFDRDGEMACRGTVETSALAAWGQALRATGEHGVRRSYGREELGERWVRHRPRESRSIEDQLATVAAWIAVEILETIDLLSADRRPDRILVGGGGARHRRILQELERRSDSPVEPLEAAKHGVSAELREAAAFAILAHERAYGRPLAFPTTTGVPTPVSLGVWAPGSTVDSPPRDS